MVYASDISFLLLLAELKFNLTYGLILNIYVKNKEIGEKQYIHKALPLNPNIFIQLIMIITKFLNNITKYLNLGKEIYVSPVYGCKHCGYEGLLHRHGFYCRNVITRYSYHRISILRVKCPSCNKTHSILPSFLIPYYQYSFDFIFECLYFTCMMKYSYSKIVSIFNNSNPNLSFNPSNIYSFKKRMKKVTPLTNSFFAGFDDFYYDMNDVSEACVLDKIKVLNENDGEFNFSYFKKMPRYFFSKT